MEESLINSNKTINYSTLAQLKELDLKTTEWATSDKGKIWFSKAELIATFTRIRYNFIEDKKNKSNFNDNDLKDVYHNLLEYKKEVLGRDSSLIQEFENNFLFINRFIKLVCSDTSQDSLSIKKSITEPFLKAAITSLQNEIKRVENITITYCNQKVGTIIDYFDSYSAILGQSSTYLRPGEKLEITTGVGAFSLAAQPKININGENVELGDEGFSLYKIKVSKTPGKYQIPVKIDFFNQTTGKQETHELSVEYTVAKECN